MRKIGFFGGALALLLILVVTGCQTVSDIPLFETGEPSLDAGSLVWKGVDGHLYVATAGQDFLTRITEKPDTDDGISYTAYAWAGEQLVYAAQEISRAGLPEAVIYSVMPGKRPRPILRRTGAASFFLYPNPDGSRVAYLGARSGQDGYVLNSVSIDGSELVMHGTGRPFYSAWSPDGTQLLTHIGLPGGTPASYVQFQSVAELVSGAPMHPPLDLTMGPFQTPAFAPDGKSVALVLNREGVNAIYAVSTDGGQATRLRGLEGAAALAWSPGGNRLAFIDGRYNLTGGVVGKLWVTDQHDGTIDLISERTAGFFWSPDGTKLLFLEPAVISADGANSVLLYRVGVYHTFEGRVDILGSMRPASEFVRQIMPFFDQYHRAYTIWSPDSRLVALSAVAQNGAPVVHLVDTELRRSGNDFSVAYRVPVQTSRGAGFFALEGVSSRILGLGTIPFFNSAPSVRPGTVS